MAKSNIPTLNVKYRPESGKNAMRRIRRAGGTPGIIFGRSGLTTPITFKVRELEELLHSAKKGLNTLFAISVDGEKKEEIPMAMIKEYQLEPVSHNFLHVSFYRVHMDRLMQFAVPIVTKGISIGVKDMGGHMEVIQREITIECLPGDVPVNYVVDVSKMKLNDTFTVGDLGLPDNVTYTGELDDPIVSIVTTRQEAEEGAEGEELEEGEEGEVSEEEGSEGEDKGSED